MKLRLSIYIALLLLCLSCSKPIEPQSIAGYVTSVADNGTITINSPDSIPAKRSYLVDDNTMRDEGAFVEGNIIEIIYQPATEEGELPRVISITSDATYPRMIGRWRTDKDDKLQIELALQPYGRILQTFPTDILQFNSWQLTGNENEITLHGTLSLPPKQRDKKDKEKQKTEQDSEELIAPQRRTMHFCATAQLADDDEGNTEQHKVLIITTDKGRKSKLYPACR